MTKEEKIKILEAKAEKLIKWFDTQELPKEPFQLNKWIKVLDARHYVSIIILRIRQHKGNPYHKLYINGYHQLDELKNYLENEYKSTNTDAATGATAC